MVPTYVNGCFAVLHPAQGTRGALICGPLSDEALNSHRALVFLGEHLAGAGVPTLRLAYYGTGDSAGSDGEPDRFAQWLDSIAAGVAWLRSQCGVTSVTLIGHRIGASLAARAACDLECVDLLVLLGPVSGRQFLHELTLAARLSQRVWRTSHALDDGTWFELHGLRIDHATRDALMRLDARKLPSPPAANVLVLDAANRAASQALASALAHSGAAASFEAGDRLDAMQRDSYEAEVPHAAFARVVDWMRALPALLGTPRAPCVNGDLPLERSREVPVRFGPDDALFGILSLPDRPSPGAPALLLVNTSANPRWGNARIAVDLSRALAEDGIATLRMDAGGMGDTDPATGERGRPYFGSVTADVLAAVTELEQRTGRPVVVMGVCSGAYHALQAAILDPRVRGLMLVNLQRFVWQEGDPSDIVRRSALRPNAFYLRSIFSARAWYPPDPGGFRRGQPAAGVLRPPAAAGDRRAGPDAVGAGRRADPGRTGAALAPRLGGTRGSDAVRVGLQRPRRGGGGGVFRPRRLAPAPSAERDLPGVAGCRSHAGRLAGAGRADRGDPRLVPVGVGRRCGRGGCGTAGHGADRRRGVAPPVVMGEGPPPASGRRRFRGSRLRVPHGKGSLGQSNRVRRRLGAHPRRGGRRPATTLYAPPPSNDALVSSRSLSHGWRAAMGRPGA